MWNDSEFERKSTTKENLLWITLLILHSLKRIIKTADFFPTPMLDPATKNEISNPKRTKTTIASKNYNKK